MCDGSRQRRSRLQTEQLMLKRGEITNQYQILKGRCERVVSRRFDHTGHRDDVPVETENV